jgi:hypothetical protein
MTKPISDDHYHYVSLSCGFCALYQVSDTLFGEVLHVSANITVANCRKKQSQPLLGIELQMSSPCHHTDLAIPAHQRRKIQNRNTSREFFHFCGILTMVY